MRLLTKEEFVSRARKIHNKKYTYDKVIYKGNHIKIIITCPIHGDFEQQPYAHLAGKGCPECGGTKHSTKEKFIEQANNIHGLERYDYSKVDYINNRVPVSIICPIHNFEFLQIPKVHLKGHGCPKCSKNYSRTPEEFINEASQIHNNYYDYSKSTFINTSTKIKIICPIHGSFWQLPIKHLNGQKCPKCVNPSSKGEIEVREYIKLIYSGEIISNDRTQLNGKELDIYLPELRLAFEYDGKYWHQLKEEKEPGYHNLKDSLAKEKNIELIHIKEEDWIKNQDETKLKILNIIDKCRRSKH